MLLGLVCKYLSIIAGGPDFSCIFFTCSEEAISFKKGPLTIYPTNEVQVVSIEALWRPRGFFCQSFFFLASLRIGSAWRLSGLMGAVGEVRKKK